MSILRQFAIIAAYRDRGITIPARKTAHSAGYDLAAAEPVSIAARGQALVPTGLKAYMEPGEVLLIVVRSSLAVHRHLVLANQVGVIDADYVDNPDNEGHIFVPMLNLSDQAVRIEAGERIAQAIFVAYRTTDGDSAGAIRAGGFGSTGTH